MSSDIDERNIVCMPSSVATAFTRRFGIEHPVAGAGLAFAAETPDLAIAVSGAGGLGAVGAGPLPPEDLRRTIRTAKRALGDRPFNVNFITVFPNEAQIAICAEEAVPVVSFHWGHPATRHLRLLQDAGVSVWEQVGTVDDALRAQSDGIEVIVAQGWEAGGHNYGGLPTFVLVPTLRDALGSDQLLLAAGGVADGRGVAAALCLGADGVWIGTRLVGTREANVHPEHHRRILQARGTDTVLSGVFGPESPGFNPMRLQSNGVVAEFAGRLADVPTDRAGQPEIGTTVFLGEPHVLTRFEGLLPTPATEADWEEVPFLMGQGVGLIHEIESAGDVVPRLMAEAHAVLARMEEKA